jgi:hypothetical protein
LTISWQSAILQTERLQGEGRTRRPRSRGNDMTFKNKVSQQKMGHYQQIKKENKMKKVQLLTIAVAMTGIAASAEMVKNPDANTLWIENGKNIKTSTKNAAGAWRTSAFSITPAKDGKGFVLTSDAKKKYYSTGCYLPVSPEYPWFCWNITDVKNLKGYRGLTMGSFSGLNCNQVGEVSHIKPGYYAVNIAQNSKLKKPAKPFLRIDQHGLQVTFEYMKMVKKPDYYIEVTSDAIKANKPIQPGDEVTFTLNLKEPAEEATLTFYKAYTMPKMKINGSAMIMMKPADKENKVWTAKVKFNTLSPTAGKGKAFKRNAIIIKADVELEENMISVLTSMPVAVNIK